ncbi:CDIF630_02480 family spore surface protein [Aminipila luticellarii]|uniref:DUF3787 domain-containing protein n=1 Tax=Aminipila luticellarii TaxID=2507160 RepID=A0A410PV55_9FIRM|nr:DUF3787 domain-containing protein [Aminipila luticellarii]QAT42790.1 DUF3787 domain-containing protein [Aminipila luticellarii]
MDDNTKNRLNGMNNMRLDDSNAVNNENTAAWSNAEQAAEQTDVNIPSEYSIEKAKNWVDNGSQL